MLTTSSANARSQKGRGGEPPPTSAGRGAARAPPPTVRPLPRRQSPAAAASKAAAAAAPHASTRAEAWDGALHAPAHGGEGMPSAAAAGAKQQGTKSTAAPTQWDPAGAAAVGQAAKAPPSISAHAHSKKGRGGHTPTGSAERGVARGPPCEGALWEPTTGGVGERSLCLKIIGKALMKVIQKASLFFYRE